jgi:hypothetical protein
MVLESTAFLPDTPSSPARTPRQSFLSHCLARPAFLSFLSKSVSAPDQSGVLGNEYRDPSLGVACSRATLLPQDDNSRDRRVSRLALMTVSPCFIASHPSAKNAEEWGTLFIRGSRLRENGWATWRASLARQPPRLRSGQARAAVPTWVWRVPARGWHGISATARRILRGLTAAQDDVNSATST